MCLFMTVRKCFSAGCECMGAGGRTDHEKQRKKPRLSSSDILQSEGLKEQAATLADHTGVIPLQQKEEGQVLRVEDKDMRESLERTGTGEFLVKRNGPGEALVEVIDRLPLEDKLRTVPLVCKEWRELSYHPAAWRSVDLTPWVQTRTDYHDRLHSSDAQLNSKLERLVQRVVDRSSGQLRDFRTIGFCTNKSVNYIAQRCPQLRKLTIPDSFQLDDNAAMELARRCRWLETLDLSDCYNVSAKSLEMFGRNNPSLTRFARNMFRIHNMNRDTLRPRGDEEAMVIGTHMVSLKILELNMMTTLTDIGSMHIAKCCRLLECLDLSGCINVTVKSLREFGNNCPSLVGFARNMDVGPEYDGQGDAEAVVIAAHMVNLKSLELRMRTLTDHGLWEIAEGCKKLVSLEPGKMCELTQITIHELFRQFPHLKIHNLNQPRRWRTRSMWTMPTIDMTEEKFLADTWLQLRHSLPLQGRQTSVLGSSSATTFEGY